MDSSNVELEYVGSKPYRFIIDDQLIVVRPNQVFCIPRKAKNKIHGHKMRRLFIETDKRSKIEEKLEKEVEKLSKRLEKLEKKP